MRRLAIPVLIVLASLATACGDSERSQPDRPKQAAPAALGGDPYPGDPSLDPVGAARAYVESIDRRDGKRFCSLVAPYISGRWDMRLNDPASRALPGTNCPKLTSDLIGYREDCCPDEFLHARVRKAAAPRVEHGLTRVDLTIDLEINEQGGSVYERHRVKPLRDTVWLVRIGGAWRVSKLSAVARAASLYVPRDGGAAPENPLTPPDVEAEQRSYAADLEELRRLLREEDESFKPAGNPADCEDALELSDPAGDVRDRRLPEPSVPPPGAGRADIRSFRIAARGERICAEWKLAGDAGDGLMISLGINGIPPGGARPAGQPPGVVPPPSAPPGNSPQARPFLQKFAIELRADGTGRVTSGEDDQDRPVPVPAELGVDGSRVTLVIDRESFERGSPSPISKGPPPFGAFIFESETITRMGPKRALQDRVGTPTEPRFEYPSGRAVLY